MTDRDTMVGRIQDETRRTDATFQAIIVEHINDAITHYQKTRFYFNEDRSETFSTVADQAFYTFSGASPDIGTQFYKIDLVEITDSNEDFELIRDDYDDLLRMNDASSTTNRPERYAYVNQGILLHETPDAVYTVTLSGHIKLAAPASGSEANNDWMTEAFDLIRSRALWSLHRRVLHEFDKAMQFRADEMEAQNQLNGATVEKSAQGYLEATEF